MEQKYIERIYMTMTGELLPAYCVPGIEDAFAEGSVCSNLYAEMLSAYWHLCDRLGVTEDADCETMINALLAIQRELCYKMFAYGVQYGRLEKE